MIDIQNISKKYPGSDTPALDDISLHINKGESFGLLGSNGAGKTTLMGIITTLILPSSGTILIDGKKMSRGRTDIKKMIAMVTQHISLRRDMTVVEHLTLTGRLYGMSASKIKERSESVLEFTGLAGKEKTTSRNLSGGMKRKLMIARALLVEPQILILDEPTVGLDPAARRKIWDLLRVLKNEGMTIILTTHYIDEAQQLCERVALLDSGHFVALSTPAKLIDELGRFAVDVFDGEHTRTVFFEDRAEAYGFISECGGDGEVRETTLEDVLIKRLGR